MMSCNGMGTMAKSTIHKQPAKRKRNNGTPKQKEDRPYYSHQSVRALRKKSPCTVRKTDLISANKVCHFALFCKQLWMVEQFSIIYRSGSIYNI
jgi:hypothetical protein